MNRKWIRLLSALMCLVLLVGQVPAVADDALEVTSAPEFTQAPAAAQEPTPGPAPVITEAPATDAPTQAPTATPTPAPVETPAPAPEGTVEATPTSAPEATPVPGADAPAEQPGIEVNPTEAAPAEAAPTEATGDGEVSLNDLTGAWISTLDAQGIGDEYHRALWLYDRLIANLAPGDAQDAQTTLTQLQASPLGYALAYEALLRAAGIECLTVTDGTFAWNLVKIDGAWTHVDVFADDVPDGYGLHFGLTDAAMARNPRAEFELPACTDASLQYFVREQGYRAFSSGDELRALLDSAAQSHAAELFLYNAGAPAAMQAPVSAMLAEIDPYASAEVSQSGPCVRVLLRYDECEPVENSDEVTPLEVSPESIVPRASSLTLGVGERASVADWTILPTGARDEVSYSSKSSSIASVSASGEVTAKKAGSTVITLKGASGLSAQVKVTVKKAPASVSITGSRSPLGVGETLKLDYKLNSGAAGGATFSVTSGAEFGEVTSDGQVTAKAPGKFTVTAETFNHKTKSVTIEVKPAPTSVALSKTEIKLGAGDSWTLTAKLNDGAAGKVTFGSLNPEIAAVDPNTGKITASKTNTGKAEIVASAYGVASASCVVEVVSAPESVKLSAPRTTIGVKEKVKLTAELPGFEGDVCTLKYKSSKSSVVSVASDGTIYGKKAGSANITVSAYNGKSYTVKITVKKAPTSMSITADRKVLGVGETMKLGYKLNSGAAGSVTFSVPADQEVIKLDPDGSIEALEVGKVTVTAQTFNYSSKNKKLKKDKQSITIEVKPAPTSVVLSRTDPIKLGAGDSWTLTAKPNEGAAGKITFSSLNPDIATVDLNSGRITAKATGEADIVATAYNNDPTATLHVQVVAAPESVKLIAPRTAIGVKEKIKLTAELPGFEGDVCTLKYKSSKSSVVSVASDGTVTGKKAGSANITVSAYNGKSYTVKITVKKAPTSMSITADRKVLGVGETMKLGYKLNSGAAGGVTFSAPADQKVIKLDPDGSIEALEVGKVTVTAQTFNYSSKNKKLKKDKQSITIEVKPAPTSIEITGAPAVLGVGATGVLKAAVNSGSAGKLYYKLADPESDVATIDASGKITARHEGTVDLVVYTYVEGVENHATLEVKPAPNSVKLPVASINLGVGDTYQIAPIIDEGTAANFSYSSNQKKYASVDGSGKVKAIKTGKKVTITVKTHNGKAVKLTVNVKNKPSSVKASPASMTLGIGESRKLGATLSKNSATTLRFESQNPEIATVAEDGTVTAVAEGTASIKITTHNGKTDKCTVTVVPAPTAIHINNPGVLGVKQSVTLTCALEPSNAHTTPAYEIVSGGEFAHFDAKTGKLVPDAEGTVVLRATCHVEGVEDSCEITILPAPTSISFDATEYAVDIHGTLQLSPTLPEGTATALTYKIAKSGYFTIAADGTVTPIKRGNSKVTVTTHNGLSASTTVWVVDPTYPEIFRLVNTPPAYMNEGESLPLELYIFPETARDTAQITWSSTNSNIAAVDASGTLQAKSYGRVTITGKSAKNPKLKVSFKLIVLSDKRCLYMPQHRTTNLSTISSTKEDIYAVRDSAYRELDELRAKGWISASEYSKRKGYIDRAFAMYLFVWTPDAKKGYWRAANSEGGRKDFKKGTYYFGMPYTQSNRTYYPNKLKNNGYVVSKDGGNYYKTKSKFKSRSYPGSDCSSFVSMAVWGYESGRKNDTTSKIAGASYYKTLSGNYWYDLRPGDLLCKGGSHVVMFLYYANAEHTQFVVIEQGGGGDDPYSNCVSTSIRDKSYYTGKGYKIRRVKGLDTGYKS